MADKPHNTPSKPADKRRAPNPQRAKPLKLMSRMAKGTAEELRKARALIDAPEKWTRGAFARDADGCEVSFFDGSICALCMAGAIRVASGESLWWKTPAHEALHRVLRLNRCDSVAIFNDDPKTAHADVMAAFDRAIEAEEATP